MNGETERILKLRTKPVQKTRAALLIPAPAPAKPVPPLFGASVKPTALLGGDERHVGVLERRLAGGDTADLDAVQLGEERRRQLALAGRLDDQKLSLLLFLDGDGRHAFEAAEPA